MAARKLKVSTTGYKENSKDKNLKELYVPSPNLTMTNVNKPVKATPVYDNGGYGMPIIMMPGVPNYNFPGAMGVIEQKFANGGDISVPDLRKVTINALPKAQTTGELKEQALQRDWNRQQARAWDPNELNGAQEVPTDNIVVKPMVIAPPTKNPPKKSKEQIAKEAAVKTNKKAQNDPTLWLLEHPEYMLDVDGNPVLKSSMEANAPAEYLTEQQKALKEDFIKDRNADPLQQSLGALTDENPQTAGAAERYANTQLAESILQKNPKEKHATRAEWINSLTPQERAIIQGSNKAYELDPSIGTRFARALQTEGNKNSQWQRSLDLTEEEKKSPVSRMDLMAPLAYPTNLLMGTLTGDFNDALHGRTPKPYFGDDGSMRDYYQPEAQAAGSMLWQGLLDPLNIAGNGFTEEFAKLNNPLANVYKYNPLATKIDDAASKIVGEGKGAFIADSARNYTAYKPKPNFLTGYQRVKRTNLLDWNPLINQVNDEAKAEMLKNFIPLTGGKADDIDLAQFVDFWNAENNRWTANYKLQDQLTDIARAKNEGALFKSRDDFSNAWNLGREQAEELKHALEQENLYPPNSPLGKKIGAGAEGTVYELASDPDYVIKVGQTFKTDNADDLVRSFEGITDNNIATVKRAHMGDNSLIEIMPNLNRQKGFHNLTKEEVLNKLEADARNLIDKGFFLDVDNLSANFKYNDKRNVVDIYDVSKPAKGVSTQNPDYVVAKLREHFDKGRIPDKHSLYTPPKAQLELSQVRERLPVAQKEFEALNKKGIENLTPDETLKVYYLEQEIFELQNQLNNSTGTATEAVGDAGVVGAGGAGETLSAAGETSNWGAKRGTDFVKTEHEDLANTIDELRADRIKFWETPKGKARLEAVIENTPELKAGGLTVDDYIAGMRSMTNENRTAVNQLTKADEILSAQENLINEFENIKFLEQQTGMQSPNGMTEQYLQDELAKLQKQLDDLKIDFEGLSINNKYVDNAFMNREGAININIGKRNPTNVPNPYTKFTTGVGQYFTIDDARRVIQHELGHYVQRGVQTNLDKELKGLDLLKNEASDLFSSAKVSSPDTQAYDAIFNKTNEYFKRARKYFNTGGKGQEKLPFLEEVRADMLEKGVIKNLGDDITEGMIRQHYANYMMEAQGGKYPLRLYDIMKNNPNNFKLLQSVMNKMPVAVIGAGVGYGMMGGDEEGQVLPQKKRGGGIKHVDFIASRNKAMLESLPKAETGGGPKLNNNPDFEVSFDISKSPEENMELNKRARQMGWNSVEEYKNSNWGQNKAGVEKIEQSNRNRKRYTSWQGVTGPGEEPISQDERTVFENTLKTVENWEKGWYSKRAMLPQFTGVAMERLSKLNDQKIVPWGNTIYENQFPDFAGHYSASYNTVNIPRGNVDEESLVTHERSHWYDFNAPQIKDYYYESYDDGKYKTPSYNDYDPILESIIPYEFSDFHKAHYRGFDPLQIPINANKQYDTEIEKVLDADTPLPSTDDFNSLQDILKPFSSQDTHDYQYRPTEIRSRLNEWRKYNNIDPLKNYTDQEIQSIIDKEINDPNKPSWWNNMDLYKVVRGRGDLLKKLNDAYVSNGNRQSSDGVFRGERGGQLPKAQTQGQTSNPNFEPSYDWQKSAAENIELNKRAQIAGWNSVNDYQKSGWAYNSRPGFAYQPDRSVPSGPQVAAPQLQNVQRNIAASKPGASVSVPEPLRQQRVAAGQPNPAYEKSSVGPTKLNAAIADENANLKAERLEKNRQKIEAQKNKSIYDEDAAGLPSVPIVEAALMAPVALSSLGAAATTFGETAAAFEAIPEVAGALRVKGAYDFGSKVVPETIKSVKDYNRTGNINQLSTGLGNVASTGIKAFSSFGPWQAGAKQIGKYYGIGTNAYKTGDAEDTQGFVKSSYDTFSGASGLLKKKDGGPANIDTLPKAQTGIPSDYQKFLQYSETAPENRRPDADWQYGNPRQYDHYGMWDALGKPENFGQALEMNPHWQPDPYDESYHGFSTNPNTGVWLKSHIPGESHPGDTGWMEYKDFMLSNDRNWGGKNQNLVYDPDLQRMRYVDRKNQGGDVKRVTIKSLPKNWKTK